MENDYNLDSIHMCKETIKSTTFCESTKVHKPEKHLPFQKDKLVQILEIRLETSINKLEFLMQTLERLKKELTDLENSWEESLSGLCINKARFYKTGGQKRKEVY